MDPSAKSAVSRVRLPREKVMCSGFRAWPWVIATLLALVALFPDLSIGEVQARACPEGMVSIDEKFCIDAYEAATDEVATPRRGKKKPKVLRRHPHNQPVTGIHVMAVSKKGRRPQGYISRDEAEQACFNAGKRLCSDDEWLTACKGKTPTTFPYGDEHKGGACNDSGVSSFNLLFGPGNNVPPTQDLYTRENMNDPRLNTVDGTVAAAGSFKKCKNAYRVFDMVGNLHEWTAAKSGTFRGGYYLDTKINGEGCNYRTTAHNATYHDYSTGFRCCYGGAEQRRVDEELQQLAQAKKSKPEEKSAGSAAKSGKKKSGKGKKGEKSSGSMAKTRSPVPAAAASTADDPYGG